MENRTPRRLLKLIYTGVETGSYLLLVLLWLYVVFSYSSLPEQIPIHFNGKGKADNFGDKTVIFVLPLLATVLFIGLNKLKQYPQYINYPVKITMENEERQYDNVRRMIKTLNIIIILTFWGIVLGTVKVARGEAEGLGIWFIPVFIILILVATSYFLLRGFRIK